MTHSRVRGEGVAEDIDIDIGIDARPQPYFGTQGGESVAGSLARSGWAIASYPPEAIRHARSDF